MNNNPIVQTLRQNAARKSDLDADKALLTKAANEIARLHEMLVRQTAQHAYPCSPHCAGYLRAEIMREALHTIVCNTEADAFPHRDYAHLAKDIFDCASAALTAAVGDREGDATGSAGAAK